MEPEGQVDGKGGHNRYYDCIGTDDVLIARVVEEQGKEGFELTGIIQPFKDRFRVRFIFRYTGISESSWERIDARTIKVP